jgi:TonB family protein
MITTRRILSSTGRGIAALLLAGLPLSGRPPQSGGPASQVPLGSAEAAAPLPVPPVVSYPESESGLDHLGKDILKAIKDGNADGAMVLAQSMVLPDPAGWYHRTFGDYSGGQEIASYTNQRAQLPLAILGFFKNAVQSGDTGVHAKRFETGCDDNDGENTFSTLDARVSSAALYDLRLYNGDKYMRLFPIAYVEGTFRFAAEPRPWDYFPHPPQAAANAANGAAQSTEGKKPITRIRQGGNVAIAKLLDRVTPAYPDVARGEHLQGTVRLHAIIAKDGTIAQLRVVKGYCSLARASLDAVQKWRYSPTTLAGQAVEVDTTIDVVFALNPR